jgi:hypothetical protein
MGPILFAPVQHRECIWRYCSGPGLMAVSGTAGGACAACGSHLGVLQWLSSGGRPWSELTGKAAALHSLPLQQWAREDGCEWDTDTCTAAAEAGRLDVL